jgi:hypothetical protein
MVTSLLPPPLRDHPVQWRTAAPLWRSRAEDPTYFLRPAILRFASDRFMDDFLEIVSQSPQRLGEWQVQRETWRRPAPNPPLPPFSPAAIKFTPDPKLESEPLKLYQPANQRYYLVVANLVCRQPGLPDRALKTQKQEKATFVLRRFLTNAAGNLQEHALINGVWQPLTPAQQKSLLPGEEEFPLFPATYRDDRAYARKLWAGLIPVSARERFLNAGRQPTAAIAATLAANLGSSASDHASLERMGEAIAQLQTVFAMDVLAPWSNLLRTYEQERKKLTPLDWGQIDNAQKRQAVLNDVNQARDRLQVASWYALLDFAYFLRDRLPRVWARVESSSHPLPPTTAEQILVQTLENTGFAPENTADNASAPLTLLLLIAKLEGILTRPVNPTVTLAQALRDTYAARNFLETTTLPYQQGDANWPASRFLLCGKSNIGGNTVFLLTIETLQTQIGAALTASPPDLSQPIPLIPEAAQIADTTQAADYGNDQFIIRCTYQRPHCPPSLHPTIVSEATIPFQMGSYYDPDAPARPIRIPMPIDTSPAGLRKFAKNTAFVLSDSLACQVEKARSLTFGDLVLSVLPWPLNKSLDTANEACPCPEGINIGKICSLSIPIISICAFILLIIIVQLLDIIFRWVPFLIFCLPLPGLKGKED